MKQSRNSILDVIRSIAAFEVLISHVKKFFFSDFNILQDNNLLLKIFYYICGFGHQAVIIFFVLSGYLVGGSILKSKPENFWRNYFIQRISRLWIVLIPCLLLTVFWNTLGRTFGGSAYLDGMLNPPIQIAPKSHPVPTDLLTFLGNIFFLQGILVPILGDNAPLWSLSFEFWYYVLFPLLYWGALKKSSFPAGQRVLYTILAIGLLLILPNDVRSGFLIWLSGVAIAKIESAKRFRYLGSPWIGIPLSIPALWMLHLARTSGFSDILVSLGLFFPFCYIIQIKSLSNSISNIFITFSDFSYTLYVAHFPLASFLWYSAFRSYRMPPSPTTFGIFLLTIVLLTGYSYLLSLLFERNTTRFRRWLQNVFPTKAKTLSS